MGCCCTKRRKRRRRKQRGGILPFLLPAAIALGKAVALGTASGEAGYGAKKALQAATRKKKVGKITWAQVQQNRRKLARVMPGLAKVLRPMGL